jgi:hypothetical protein
MGMMPLREGLKFSPDMLELAQNTVPSETDLNRR